MTAADLTNKTVVVDLLNVRRCWSRNALVPGRVVGIQADELNDGFPHTAGGGVLHHALGFHLDGDSYVVAHDVTVDL